MMLLFDLHFQKNVSAKCEQFVREQLSYSNFILYLTTLLFLTFAQTTVAATISAIY